MFKQICFILLIALFSLTDAAVLGIDFGTDYVKVAIVAPGHAFEIALDPSSKRKHPAMVGFDDGERRFGNDARSLITKRPKQTFQKIQSLLGKKIDSPAVEEFATHHYPYEFIEDEVRGTIRLRFGEEKTFSVEEIVAMYLRHAQHAAVSFLESSTPIRDCVITVPDFWSTKERQALLDAASLADLNVLSLINENSAAALYYGVEKNYEINKTENFIFYNMGSGSTKVSVVEYGAWLKTITKRKNKTVGQVAILGQAWDETLGGNAFDLVMINHLKVEAEKQLNTDLSKNFRALNRIRVAAEKSKRILSANTEGTVRITSLWDDRDFKMRITRDEFMELSADLLKRAMVPLQVALDRAGLQKEDMEGIVLMGGGSRVPKLQEMLLDFIGKPLRRDLNTDEAAALGAAFRAANESTTFRVRQIGFVDQGQNGLTATINNFDDFLQGADLDSADFRKSAEIFEEGSQFKRRKAVHFKHDQELFISIAHKSEDNLPAGTSIHINSYNVSGIKKAVKDYSEKNVTDTKPKVSLSFGLDVSGIAKLVKATATFQENVEVAIPRIKNTTVEEPEKEEKPKEDAKGEEKEDAKGEEKDAEEAPKEGEEAATEEAEDSDEKEEAPESEGKPAEEGEPAKDAAEEKPEEEAKEKPKEEEAPAPVQEYDYVWKTMKRRVTLKVRALGSDVKCMNTTDKRKSKTVLKELEAADQAIRDTAAALNDLEAYILEHRPYLYEDEDENIMKVSTEEERETLVALLSEAEDWLFDVEDATAQVYKTKLREVTKVVQPVFVRAYEYSQRDHYITVTREHLGAVRKMITNLTETMTWVNKTEFDKLNNATNDFELWFNKKCEEQAKRELTEEPAFKVDQIKDRVESLSEQVRRVAMRPKPAEKPKKKKKKKAKKKKKKDSEDETEAKEGAETKEEKSEPETKAEEDTEEPPKNEEEPLSEDHEEL